VPMVQPPTPTPSVRLGTGQTRTQQQAAVVTGLSIMTPYDRTPQEVVAALLQDPGRPELALRPRPVGKERRASRAGQAEAMSCVAQRVAQRDGAPMQQRIARTDGAEARHPQGRAHFPA
jgi:hypothetical protein